MASYNERYNVENGIDHENELLALLANNSDVKEAYDLCKKVLLKKNRLIHDMRQDISAYKHILQQHNFELPATQTLRETVTFNKNGKHDREEKDDYHPTTDLDHSGAIFQLSKKRKLSLSLTDRAPKPPSVRRGRRRTPKPVYGTRRFGNPFAASCGTTISLNENQDNPHPSVESDAQSVPSSDQPEPQVGRRVAESELMHDLPFNIYEDETKSAPSTPEQAFEDIEPMSVGLLANSDKENSVFASNIKTEPENSLKEETADESTRANWREFNTYPLREMELVRPLEEIDADFIDEQSVSILPDLAFINSLLLYTESFPGELGGPTRLETLSPSSVESHSDRKYDSASGIDLYNIPQYEGSDSDSESIVEISQQDFERPYPVLQSSKKLTEFKQKPSAHSQVEVIDLTDTPLTTENEESALFTETPTLTQKQQAATQKPHESANYESTDHTSPETDSESFSESIESEAATRQATLEKLIWDLWTCLIQIPMAKRKNDRRFEDLGGTEWDWNQFVVLASQEGYSVLKQNIVNKTVSEVSRAMIPIIDTTDVKLQQRTRQDVLRQLWLQLLPDLTAADITLNSNFFHIGGYSLLVMQLIKLARKDGYLLSRSVIANAKTLSKMARRLVLKKDVEDLQASIISVEEQNNDEDDKASLASEASLSSAEQQQKENDKSTRKRDRSQVDDIEYSEESRDQKRPKNVRNSSHRVIEEPLPKPSVQGLFDRGIILLDEDRKNILDVGEFAVSEAIEAHEKSEDVIKMINRLIENGRRLGGNPGQTIRFINRLAIRYEYHGEYDAVREILRKGAILQDRGSPVPITARKLLKTHLWKPTSINKAE